mgnify:CR=1 FL=1
MLQWAQTDHFTSRLSDHDSIPVKTDIGLSQCITSIIILHQDHHTGHHSDRVSETNNVIYSDIHSDIQLKVDFMPDFISLTLAYCIAILGSQWPDLFFYRTTYQSDAASSISNY